MMKLSILTLVVSSKYLHRSVSSVFFTKHMKGSKDIFVHVYVVKPNKWSRVIASSFLTPMLDGGEQVTSSPNRFSSTERTPVHLAFRGPCIISIFRYMYIPYPTAFPYGNGMVLHFYQQQESRTTKTVHKVFNKRLKTYV